MSRAGSPRPAASAPDAEPAADRVPASWRLFAWLMRRLPQAAISRGFGRLADLPIPRPLRSPVLGLFARAVGADIAEAARPLADYPSLDAFFVRRLRPGCRPMPPDPDVLVSPVDGTMSASGPLADGTLLQAKGLTYTAAELLGDAIQAARFEGGSFATIYLSPKDYHRIHAPCAGELSWARHEPGRLLPVNRPMAAVEPRLFARNERVSCILEGASGPVAVVAVGAINVGRISTAFDDAWAGPRGGVTNRRGARPETRLYEPPVPVVRGDELMAFHLGSTVVLLVAPGRAVLIDGLCPGEPVRLGNVVARRG